VINKAHIKIVNVYSEIQKMIWFVLESKNKNCGRRFTPVRL